MAQGASIELICFKNRLKINKFLSFTFDEVIYLFLSFLSIVISILSIGKISFSFLLFSSKIFKKSFFDGFSIIKLSVKFFICKFPLLLKSTT